MTPFFLILFSFRPFSIKVSWSKLKPMEFFRYSALFFVGGILGWVIELFFRRFVSAKKWVNPGFLAGPLLPLYGFGVCALYLLSSIPYDWVGPEWAQYLVKILFIGLAMTIVELIAGLIFIKGLKVKLWDYSDRWGNFQGIICPLFSAIWTAVGAAYVFLVHPLFVKMTDYFLSVPLALMFVLGFAYGILLLDVVHSFNLVVKIRKAVSESKLVVDWDKMKSSFAETKKRLKEKASWLFPLNGNGEDFKIMVSEYKNKLQLDRAVFQKKMEEKKADRLAKAAARKEKKK